MLKPSDLTDEILREEYKNAPTLPRRMACQMLLDCDTALHMDGTDREIEAARLRICDVLNRRGD